jgi:hypothetical protein
MVLYTYKYWFKMLKQWKFSPLIKGRASSTNCTMGNLACSHHATYLHTIYVKSPPWLYVWLANISLDSQVAPPIISYCIQGKHVNAVFEIPGHPIVKIWVITGNGIGIKFRSNINNAKVPMIVYLKSFIFTAILRGNLGKSTRKTWKE